MWNYIALFAIGVIVFAGCCFNKTTRDLSALTERTRIILDDSVNTFKSLFKYRTGAKFTKRQIIDKLKRLKKLDDIPKAEEMDISATCYAPIAKDYHTAVYICPICGCKTLYSEKLSGKDYRAVSNIVAIRRLVDDIQGVNIGLKEYGFCNNCDHDASDRELVLYINIEGEEVVSQIPHISLSYLNVLKAFLDDQLAKLSDDDVELDYYRRILIDYFNLKEVEENK